MRFLDAMVCVCLALEINKTDAAVRATAKRCIKKLSAKDRVYMMKIINSPHPALHVKTFLTTLPDHILNIGAGKPGETLIPFKKSGLDISSMR
jgi:hypothetical protein